MTRQNMEIPELSIVIPARDEEGNIDVLLEELIEVLSKTGLRWEVIIVNDASSDRTGERLREAQRRYRNLNVISFPSHLGKSAALAAGISKSQGLLIGMMDADLQNCPQDFLPMMAMMAEDRDLALVQGHRVSRQDSWLKCQASRLGFLMRGVILGDSVRDTGCALRLFRRRVAKDLPLHFEGIHRFLPYLTNLHGGKVRELAVDHRPRHLGTSKYQIGPINRGLGGLLDLLAVRWMTWRFRLVLRAESDKTLDEL